MWGHVGIILYLAALVAGQEQPRSTTSVVVSSEASHLAPSLSPASTQIPSIASVETCEARSINYVTHTLLQQCLGRTYSPYTTSTANSTNSATAAGQPAEITAVSGSHNPTHPTHHTTDLVSGANVKPGPAALDTAQKVADTATATALPVAVPPDAEEESLLDNAKFLSFEDWKKQNLVEKGLPDPLEKHKGVAGEGQTRRHPGINNALDGLGEDAEIEIDFGFGSYEPVKEASNTARAGIGAKYADGAAQAPKTRSKDAGKTCKERTNYASFDCAASILKTNSKCKSPSSVLVENKDSYMLNECSQDNKFLIVELCEGVLIDTLVLANFEFFSSMFRTFKVSVSDRYPVKADKWVDLGTYEARNSREIQPFLIENPQIFARYLRIEFLTHFGSEYYCPVSLIRAHGITMFEQYRMEQQFLNGDIDDGEDEEVPVASALDAPIPTAVVELQAEVTGIKKPSDGVDSSSSASRLSSSSSSSSSVGNASGTTTTNLQDSMASTPQTSSAASTLSICPVDTTQEPPISSSTATCTPVPVTGAPSISESSEIMKHNTSASTISHMTKQPSSSASVLSQVPQTNATSTEQTTPSSTVVVQDKSNSTSSSQTPSQASSSISSSSVSPSSVPAYSNSTMTSSSATATPTSSIYTASTAHPAPPAPPATQESFFKSIHKRLSFLEANSTLSLQYIEAQSQLLREAFSKVEKRNVVTTSKFLETLNSTVLAEMARFKGEYEQLWQSTVLELASQRDEGRRERDLLGERVRLLAEEMVSQKRLMAAQAILLLLCLSIVVFAKFGTSAGVDSSLVQGMQELVMMRSRRPQSHKHKTSNGSLSLGRRWPWESPWASPPRSRDITRPHTASGHERGLSMEHERGLHEMDADDGDAHSLGNGSPSPDSPHPQGDSGGRMSNSDTDEASQDHGLSIRFAPGVGDGLRDGHDDEHIHDATTSNNSEGSAVGLGLKRVSRLDEAGAGTRLIETRSAPTTPRPVDCASSGGDASKT